MMFVYLRFRDSIPEPRTLFVKNHSSPQADQSFSSEHFRCKAFLRISVQLWSSRHQMHFPAVSFSIAEPSRDEFDTCRRFPNLPKLHDFWNYLREAISKVIQKMAKMSFAKSCLPGNRWKCSLLRIEAGAHLQVWGVLKLPPGIKFFKYSFLTLVLIKNSCYIIIPECLLQ